MSANSKENNMIGVAEGAVGRTVTAAILTAHFNCDLVYTNMITLVAHSVSNPASVISEKNVVLFCWLV